MNYRFFYTSYCQAYQIEKWAPAIDGQGIDRCVAYSWYDLPSVGRQSEPSGTLKELADNDTPQSGCPRFAERIDWAEYWNNSQEAAHNYSYFDITDGKCAKIVDPLGRIYRTDVSTDGLTQTSRVWTNETSYGTDAAPNPALKTVTTVFERFSDGPQPTSVTVSDENSAKKTEFAYTNVGGVSLLNKVTEYPNNGVTIYRVTETAYNTDPNYSSRHIFGLPQSVSIYRGSDLVNPIAVTQFAYDEPAYFDPASFSAFQHDAANYGGYFIGRANLTTVTQQEIPGGGSRATRRVKYDKTGQPIEGYDTAGNVTRFHYEDNFLPGQSVEQTHAMLTRTQDPDGYWSGARYDCYTGLPAESYHIAGQTGDGAQENTISYEYDIADRPSAINRPDGGRTTYNYWDNWLAVAEYTLIDSSQFYYRYSANTGDGRVRWLGGDHPDGTSDKYWIEKYEFDAGGRAVKISKVTAVTSDGTPIDENAAEGYSYTTISFDALDRQTEIEHPDQNKVFYSYEGCGCAGGWTVTSRDERGRKRRQIYDFLGRLCRGQELNTNDEVYSQARCFYDERDLLLRIEHSDGDEAHHQDRTFEFDGYGRVWKETAPEKGLVEYSYKPSDLIASVTDERGVVVNYDYNKRSLVKHVLYNEETPDVFYDYGEYGERLWMQEKDLNGNEIGRTDYGYDQYKRLRSETRGISGLPGAFKVEYEYNLAGLATKLIYTVNDWLRQVNYDYNLAGVLRSVGTDIIAGDATSNIASGYDYLASAALMSVNYGNGRKLVLGYNLKRSQLNSLQLKRIDDSDPILSLTYDYYSGGGGSDGNNGRLRHIDDLLNGVHTADFSYDEYNRLTGYGPNNQRSYSFDPWGNLLSVTSSTGGGEAPNYSLSYETNATGAPLNNRIGNADYSYDNTGNMTGDGIQAFTFDGANRLKTAGGENSSYDYDGDGWRVKQSNSSGTIYYLWSSLLGEPVIEMDGGGGMYRIYLYSPGGQLMGLQGSDGGFYWVHADHLGSGRTLTDASGAEVYRSAFDPHGQVLEETLERSYLNSHKFTGYERDWATGIDNAKARGYHYKRGRFLQPDPLGVAAADLTNPQSLNRYSYVSNDPVNFIDPSGLLRICFWNYSGISNEVGGVSWFLDSIECINTLDIGYGPIESPLSGFGGQTQERKEPPVESNCPDNWEQLLPTFQELNRTTRDWHSVRASWQ